MISLFANVEGMQKALDYHLERQNVLVANIAHVDTPGYVPKDVERVDGNFAGQMALAMSRTEGAHIGGAEMTPSNSGRIFNDPAESPGNDKNYVSLDRESAKAASNQLRYDVISTLVSAEFAGLQFAAGDGK